MGTTKKAQFKLLSLFLLLAVMFTACATQGPTSGDIQSGQGVSAPSEPGQVQEEASGIPKYIFMFIGDGMGINQPLALGYLNGTVENNFTGTTEAPTPENPPTPRMPSFLEFPVLGLATNYDASKFITDSASGITAMTCGVKTLDAGIGVDPYDNRLDSFAEVLKAQAGYKIGIVTSVSLDHATPAGFFAHTPNRSNYYDIGLDLIASDFDFFGGGGFKQPTGKENDQDDLLELAEQAGYNVVNTKEEIEALGPDAGKTIAITPDFDNPRDVAINFAIDRDENELALPDFVRKAIDVLGDEQGFFIMVESGKLDWACHANDAYTALLEVKDLEDSVNVALAFAEEHPDETLILVTADHETGGFSIGSRGTNMNTHLSLLLNQKISYRKYAEYIAGYRDENTTFEEAMADVKELFGLVMPDDPNAAAADEALVLSEKDVARLRDAYEASMVPPEERVIDQDYKNMYSSSSAHEPFHMTVTTILDNRAGLGWTSVDHTALPVALYAFGAGQEAFSGYYDNTEICGRIMALVGVPFGNKQAVSCSRLIGRVP